MQRFSLILLVAICLVTTGCGNLTMTIGLSSGDSKLRATTVAEEAGAQGNRVAIIDVSGMIMNMHKPALLSVGENPVALLQEQLKQAEEDANVKAVILRINSPGGTVTASDIMYREVTRFRASARKPVVVLMMDVAASGGYYLACGGDYIVAHPSTITGSIGVIIQTLSLKPMLERWGVEAHAITSGKNKAAGSPLGTLTEEHRAVLKELVDDFYKRFTAVVRSARPHIPPDRFADVTDGRVFSGEDALSVGLVDQLGDLHDAFAKAKELARVSKADMVIYHRPLQYVGSPYATAPGATPAAQATGGTGTQINVLQLNLPEMPGQSTVGVYYLWQPG